jgi:hypothetical protein
MTWFWMNVAAAFCTACTAIPLWLVLKQPDTATGPQVSAVPSAPAGRADGQAGPVPAGEPRLWRAVSRSASRRQNQLTGTAKPAAAWPRPARRGYTLGSSPAERHRLHQQLAVLRAPSTALLDRAGHPPRTVLADLLRAMRPKIAGRGLATGSELDALDAAARRYLANPDTWPCPSPTS